MTAFDRFDPFEQRIADALGEIAPARRPDYLDDILGVTTRTSQRPRWTFLERWLPMDTTLARTGRLERLPIPPVVLLALLALLLAGVGFIVVAARLIHPPDEIRHLAGVVEPVGSMHAPVVLPQAVGLSDGSLLVGGTVLNGDSFSPHLEVFDPSAGAFAAIPLSVQGSTQLQSMVRLADGSVLLGLQQGSQNTAEYSALVFDGASSSVRPATGVTAPVEPGSAEPRLPPDASPDGYPAIALADGRTLYLTSGVDLHVRAILYDPTTGDSRAIPAPLTSGGSGSADRLPDGRVLFLGTDEAIFDPRTEAFTILDVQGTFHFVGWLKDGRALLAGTDPVPTLSLSAGPRPWTFDPATGVFAPLRASADASTAGPWFILPDGRVLMLEATPYDGSPATGDTRAWILH